MSWVSFCAGSTAAIGSLLAAVSVSAATPIDTSVTVRVQAHDAKFIGSGVGEMNVIIEDAGTGAWLAAGRITGGTGDTERLIEKPAVRGAPRADGGTASYTATLRLDRPTRIRIRAYGPLEQPDAAQELVVTTWVVPGRPIVGDGIVLQLPGLIVTPASRVVSKGQLALSADVKLMCGCPITKDGLWDADEFEVRAVAVRPGEAPTEAALRFTGQTNRFAGDLAVATPGQYQVTVWGHNAKTGNTGAAFFTVDVP